MTNFRNGEPRIEDIMDSLETLFRGDKSRGVKEIVRMLEKADETDARALWDVLKKAGAVNSYLAIYKQGINLVRRCGWHPKYNDGQEAIIVSRANLPAPVPNDYFKNVGNITDGLCRFCREIAIKEELK